MIDIKQQLSIKQSRFFNKFDVLIIILIASNFVGLYGMPLTLPRLIDIFLAPYIISTLKNYKQYPSYILIFFCIWIICSTISLVWTPNKINGIKLIGYNVLSIIGFMAIIKMAAKGKNPQYALIYGWVILFLMTAPIAINEILNDVHLSNCAHLDGTYIVIDGKPSNRKFASVTFGNLNAYNLILVLCIPYILEFQLLRNIRKAIKFSTVIVLIYIIILNSSRGALVCLTIEGFVFIVLSLKHKAINKMSLLCLILTITLVLIINFDLLLSQIVSRIAEGGLASDDSRVNLINNGIEVIKNSLFLGCGIGGLETALIAIAPNSIPALHNMFLEVTAEYGLVVSIAFICFIWASFKGCLRSHSWHIRLLGWMFMGGLIPLSIINSGYLAETALWIYFASIISFTYIKNGQVFN